VGIAALSYAQLQFRGLQMEFAIPKETHGAEEAMPLRSTYGFKNPFGVHGSAAKRKASRLSFWGLP